MGVGDTTEQVGSFPGVAAGIVAGYRADVLDSAQQVIRSLSEADLETTNPDRNPRPYPRPTPTFNWVLARIPVECSQHIGQVAYIRGLRPDQEDWRGLAVAALTLDALCKSMERPCRAGRYRRRNYLGVRVGYRDTMKQ